MAQNKGRKGLDTIQNSHGSLQRKSDWNVNMRDVPNRNGEEMYSFNLYFFLSIKWFKAIQISLDWVPRTTQIQTSRSDFMGTRSGFTRLPCLVLISLDDVL